jgi:glycosyltransferase involved in cell wall biosynthesis
MEIKIDIDSLRSRKLFVATPMYGGQCAGMYTRSICDLTALCVRYGIEVRSYFLFNESLITRARNYCVDEFLRSDAEHLLFIDSDIGFNPQDVIAMMALQSPESDYDVIAAPYPKKCITWEKIFAAVNKGVADNNPNILEDFVGDFVFNPVFDGTEETRTIRLDEPAQVLETGTGFMMIRRKTFEKYLQAYPEIMYKPDHVRTEAFDGSRKIGMYFQAEVDRHNPAKLYEDLVKRIASGENVSSQEATTMLVEAQNNINNSTDRYLSEDYLFCQNTRKAGMKVWLCPWMHLQHSGTYVFGGKLPALASIGASATADADLIRKMREGQAASQLKPVNVAPAISHNPDILKKFKKVGS